MVTNGTNATNVSEVGRKVDVDDLVDVAEIADRLGVERNTIHHWRRRYRDDDAFPEPIPTLRLALVWEWKTVDKWAKRHGFPHDGRGRPAR